MGPLLANGIRPHLDQQLAFIAECLQVLDGPHVLQDEHVSALGQNIKSLNRPGVTCGTKCIMMLISTAWFALPVALLAGRPSGGVQAHNRFRGPSCHDSSQLILGPPGDVHHSRRGPLLGSCSLQQKFCHRQPARPGCHHQPCSRARHV